MLDAQCQLADEMLQTLSVPDGQSEGEELGGRLMLKGDKEKEAKRRGAS